MLVLVRGVDWACISVREKERKRDKCESEALYSCAVLGSKKTERETNVKGAPRGTFERKSQHYTSSGDDVSRLIMSVSFLHVWRHQNLFTIALIYMIQAMASIVIFTNIVAKTYFEKRAS